MVVKKMSFGIFVILLLIANSAFAAIDVNKTAILVNDSKVNDPFKLKQAFAQILVNNTGEKITTVLRNSVFLDANIKSGVKRSYFEKIDKKYFNNTNAQKYWFHLVMKAGFVQNVIEQAQFSVLPLNREKIVLWIAKQEPKDGQLLADYAGQNDQSLYWIKRWAQALAINLQIPLMDVKDKAGVSIKAIKTMSATVVNYTKKRYQEEDVLLVYLSIAENSLKIRSGYFHQGQNSGIKYFKQNSTEQGEVFYSVFENLAHKIASYNRVDSQSIEKHSAQIVINSISNYDQINALKSYFDKLSIIDNYTIVAANLGQLVITADLKISSNAFIAMVEKDNRLTYKKDGSINQLVFTIN